MAQSTLPVVPPSAVSRLSSEMRLDSVAGSSAAEPDRDKQSRRVLTLSTMGFTLLFAVWLMFGIIGIPIQKQLGLTDVQFFWLGAVAILNGAIWRLLFGILTDRWGGRRVFTGLLLFSAVSSFLVSRASTYSELLVCAFLVGIGGNAFSAGVAWNSAWFPRDKQGFALGMFGAGNVGASITKMCAPLLMALIPAAGLFGIVPGGWRAIPVLYAGLLVLMAAATWLLSPSEDLRPGRGRPLAELLRPLREMRVWRFSLYYVVVFGAYVAFSLALPKYYMHAYGLSLAVAALVSSLFIFPASLLRPVGGYLSDRIGPRRVMYGILLVLLLATSVLAFSGMLLGHRLGVVSFTALMITVGVGMGIGKAAVFKYIPEYFPRDVAAVGGLVGVLGALGGFFLPLMFGYLQKWTGLDESPFLVLFVMVGWSLGWLHLSVTRLRAETSWGATPTAA